jgi:hypothetical protein
VYFYNKPDKKAVYPTEHGWLDVHDKNWLQSDPIDFSDSPQFTVVFEVFPLTSWFGLKLFPYHNNEDIFPTHFGFAHWSTYVQHPWNPSGAVKLEAKKWNRVRFPFKRYR